MPISKMQSESVNLADNFAFTGTVTGAGGGKVLQVVSTTKTDSFAASVSNALVDITGMSLAITPSSTSSKIFIIVQCAVSGGDAGIGLTLLRGSTPIAVGDTSSSKTSHTMIGFYGSSSPETYSAGSNHISFLDSPNTTSATTYKLQGRAISASIVVNRSYYDLDNANASRNSSTITLMEIAG